ncbi:MAG: hypothetical protein GXY76_16475 [Chloroflexi bacterium]|nr:hypothetical protein [Chloroflexota bacterium]
MSLSIADTSQGVFFFCDEATADVVRPQVINQSTFRDLKGNPALPPGIYFIILPDAAEAEPEVNPVPLPPFEINEEAMLERVRAAHR